jgi:hypothetical protein
MKKLFWTILLLVLILSQLATLSGVNADSFQPPKLQWEKTLGNIDGFSIVQSQDGNFVLAAQTGNYNPSSGGSYYNETVTLYKIDAAGNILWTDNLPYWTYGTTMKATTDGGFALLGRNIVEVQDGYFANYYWLVKVDANGKLEWNQTYPTFATGNALSTFNSLGQTNDGGYIMSGSTYLAFDPNKANAWVLKTDSQGNVQWNKTYNYATAASVFETADNGYIFAGSVQQAQNNQDCLVKLDSSGNIEWTKTFANRIRVDFFLKSNSTYLLLELVYGAEYLTATDANGNLLWNRTYPVYPYSYGSLAEAANGSYLLAGSYGNDGYLTKIDSDGNSLWNVTFSGLGSSGIFSVFQIQGDGYVFTGATGTYGPRPQEIWVAKTTQESQIVNPSTPNFPIWIIPAVAVIIVLAVLIARILRRRL